MREKNQMMNEDQDQQRITETQIPESRSIENRREHGEISESASDVTSSESSSTVVPSDLSAKKEVGETNAQMTNIQTPQGESDQPARRGPTGPRTDDGKKRSSQNAVKSGIFSRATLLKGESRAEYQSLVEGFWKTLQPEGKLEELLVEKLVSISWRYRRLLVAEGAEIRNNSEFLELDQRRMQQEGAEQISQSQQAGTGAGLDFTLELVGLIWNIQNPDIIDRCLELLAELGQGIKDNGLDEENDGLLLKRIYGNPARPHLRPTLQDEYLTWFETASVTEQERAREGYATPEQCRQHVSREIDAEINRLKQYQKKSESIESERRKVEILRQSVPDSRALDRLLRYENSLERAFDRTLTQLERLQRVRKGQPLPPELDIKVS